MPGWGVGAAEAKVTDPAWKHKPSYYLIARDDQMLSEPLRRRMAERAGMDITEAPCSHAVYVSQPDAVAPGPAGSRELTTQRLASGTLGALRGSRRSAGLIGRGRACGATVIGPRARRNPRPPGAAPNSGPAGFSRPQLIRDGVSNTLPSATTRRPPVSSTASPSSRSSDE